MKVVPLARSPFFTVFLDALIEAGRTTANDDLYGGVEARVDRTQKHGWPGGADVFASPALGSSTGDSGGGVHAMRRQLLEMEPRLAYECPYCWASYTEIRHGMIFHRAVPVGAYNTVGIGYIGYIRWYLHRR